MGGVIKYLNRVRGNQIPYWDGILWSLLSVICFFMLYCFNYWVKIKILLSVEPNMMNINLYIFFRSNIINDDGNYTHHHHITALFWTRIQRLCNFDAWLLSLALVFSFHVADLRFVALDDNAALFVMYVITQFF